MKARPRPDWHDPNNQELRRRIISDFAALRGAEKYEVQCYLLMAMCIAVHDTFGAGEKRLERFFDCYVSTIRRMDKYFKDDAMDIIFREIEKLGVSFLIDDYNKSRQDVRKAMHGTFLDTKHN